MRPPTPSRPAGTHTATATATDSAGVTTVRAATVTVTSPAQSGPQPPPTSPPGKAVPAAITASQLIRLPSTKACVSRRNFKVRLRAPGGVTIASAAVFVNGKRVDVIKGKRLRAPVSLIGLPKGRFTVKITVTTATGRKVTGTRRYRTCTPKHR